MRVYKSFESMARGMGFYSSKELSILLNQYQFSLFKDHRGFMMTTSLSLAREVCGRLPRMRIVSYRVENYQDIYETKLVGVDCKGYLLCKSNRHAVTVKEIEVSDSDVNAWMSVKLDCLGVLKDIANGVYTVERLKSDIRGELCS